MTVYRRKQGSNIFELPPAPPPPLPTTGSGVKPAPDGLERDLETLLRERQDELRGGPLPPPTPWERMVEAYRRSGIQWGPVFLCLCGTACMISAAIQAWGMFSR